MTTSPTPATPSPEPAIITYAAVLYDDKSITIAAGLAAVMSAHNDASQHDKDCALAWFHSRYIKGNQP